MTNQTSTSGGTVTLNQKFLLSNAILELEALLEQNISVEAEYQKFFENNPLVFQLLGYQQFWSFTKSSDRSLTPDRYTGLKPEPDFITQTHNGLFEIFEIKTPVSTKLVVDSNKYRERFTAEVASYIAQTSNYDDYFTRNPENRKNLQDKYGITLNEDLNIKIIIGRDKFIDKSQIHREARRFRYIIDILTYDYVLQRLKDEYQRIYGIYEDVPGFSLHLIARLKGGKNQRKKYILDVGELLASRISLYLDELDDICFEVIDSNKRSHQIKIDSIEDNFFDEWLYLFCEFGFTAEGFVMAAAVNGIEKAEHIRGKVDLEVPVKNLVLGCSLSKSNFGYFDCVENFIYHRKLTYREKSNLLAYISDKYSDLTLIKQYMKFNGHQYLRRDENGNLTQENKTFMPMLQIIDSSIP